MAHHTLVALAFAGVRYLSQRTRLSEETVLDRFYTETGGHPERDAADLRRWVSKKIFLMDQLQRDPFASPEEAA
jgi:hypothetical protein